jgi:hypothetical protein
MATTTTVDLATGALMALERAGAAYAAVDAADFRSSAAYASAMLSADATSADLLAGSNRRSLCSPAHVMARLSGTDSIESYARSRANLDFTASCAMAEVAAQHQQARRAAAEASAAVHAVSMSFHARLCDAKVMVHTGMQQWLNDLANLADGPGGHGATLVRLVISLESMFRWGTIRNDSTGGASDRLVLGATHTPIGGVGACAAPVVPAEPALAMVRWLPLAPATLALLASARDGFGTASDPFLHVVSGVKGKWLMRLRRTGKIYVSLKMASDTAVACVPPVDITWALDYAKRHLSTKLPEGITMHANSGLQVRTVVRSGVLVRCDVVM